MYEFCLIYCLHDYGKTAHLPYSLSAKIEPPCFSTNSCSINPSLLLFPVCSLTDFFVNSNNDSRVFSFILNAIVFNNNLYMVTFLCADTVITPLYCNT